MANIIIKSKTSFGKTRSEQEKNLRKEGWGGTMDDGQLDKCKYLERKVTEATGAKKVFPKKHHIKKVK